MQPVDRQRAWALRGSFVVLLDGGRKIKLRWPSADVLLDHNPASRPLERIVHLAATKATDLVEALLAEDPLVAELLADDLENYFGCTQSHRLVSLLNRYESPISNDLAETFGVELDDLHRGLVLPDQLMNRIDGLPRHSRLSEALAQDDELAAQLAGEDLDEDAEPTAPSVRHTEWTPEVEALSLAVDRLGALIGVVAAVAGSSINLPPAPRPVGAATRLRASREDAQYDDLMSDIAAAQALHAAIHEQAPEEA